MMFNDKIRNIIFGENFSIVAFIMLTVMVFTEDITLYQWTLGILVSSILNRMETR